MSTFDTEDRAELAELRADIAALRAEVEHLKAEISGLDSATPGSMPTMHSLGFSFEEAALIRAQMSACQADWEAPEMDAYDKYIELFRS